MDFRRQHAKRLVLWIGCLITVSCIWISCYYQVKHDTDQATSDAQTTATNFAKAFEDRTRGNILQIDSTLRTMRDDYVQHPEYFAEQLVIYKKNMYRDLIIQVSVIDRNGFLVFNEGRTTPPIDLSDREHFRVHRSSSEDVLFISKPVLGRISKRWTIQFTRKIVNHDGSFGGVMVISVDPAYFTSFFGSFDLGEHGVVTLLGNDRVIRARTLSGNPLPSKGETLPAQRAFFDPRKPDAGIYTTKSAVDGVSRIYAYRRLRNYPLIISVGLPVEEVYRAANSRKATLILWGTFFSALLLIGTRIILLFDKQQSRTELSLREANQRLQLATASGHLGIWEWDLTTRSLVWDARMLELYGIEPASFAGTMADFEKAVHPEDREEVMEQIAAMVRAGNEFSAEFRIIHADGGPRNIRADGLVIRDAAGRARRVIGLSSDITEHTAAVDALRESEKRFRTLAEASFEGIAIVDGERYFDVNTQLAVMLGFERDELIGMNVAATLPPDPAQGLPGTAPAESSERETLCKDGSRRFVEVHGQSILQNGRELKIMAIRDITGRKEMEKALHDSEEQFRTLCDAAPIGIFRSDSAGNTIYCNPRCEEITGMPASLAIGQPWIGRTHPEDSEEVRRIWREVVRNGETFSHEHRQLTPQGKTIWIRALAKPILSPDGAVVSHVGTLEDITDLRQASQDMLKTQKLQSLGVLAGGIAHDFNNILTAIFANVSLARMQMAQPEKALKRLESAETAITRATDLTKQLLTFARGGAPIKKVIRVNELLQEGALFVLHGSKADCRFELAEDIWPVEADEGQVVQVVHNLVLNAVQAMPEGGIVTVTSENASAPHAGGKFVTFSIRDTGTGIPEKVVEEIFDPYFTTKPQGNGLGLATCYSIVQKHGGTITVASTEGEGSTFTVSLPASDQGTAHGKGSQEPCIHGRGRVLVMDDDEDIRDLAREILQELEYTVEVAENGAGAVDLYQQRKGEGLPFSAVILDLTIRGGMGGKETIEKLLEIDPAVKAIVSSGYSNDTVMANYRDHGFQAVLSKPYLPREMSKVLIEVASAA